MKTDKLIEQLEIYSNAIVGFVALQTIAFGVSFGTNEFFNCVLRTARFLAHGLTLNFTVALVVCCYAILSLSRMICELSPDNHSYIRRLYLAKCIAICIFTAMPLALVIGYGVVDYPTKADCKVAKYLGHQ
jgi:hypothetical protein